MNKYPFFYRRFSRRQILCGALAAGGAACAGSGSCGAFSLIKRNAFKRRFAPDDGLSLSDYIDREASKMDILPYYILTTGVRFYATLTFERYLPFFRFKERVLAATKEEIDDCVRQIDVFSTKKKALVLFAAKLFGYVYYCPPKNRYQHWYHAWRESAKETTKSIDLNCPENDPTDLDHYEERSFSPGKRPYYPYSYPVRQARYVFRSLLILGEPNPDSFVDEELSLRWNNVKEKFFHNKEIAFPALTEPPEDSRSEEIKETLLRLVNSPLRFLVYTAWKRGDNESWFDPPKSFEQSDLLEWRRAIDSGQLKKRSETQVAMDHLNPNLSFWVQWFRNIEDCVSIIRRELNLTISPERWISDYYPDADAFLKKVAELESDESAPHEKVELLVALREYWFSMQTLFDYDRYSEWVRLRDRTQVNPFYDFLGARDVTLQDVALKIVDFL